MALYFTDRKCTSTFCLNVCRGNVMKDVRVAIILFQLAVASGPHKSPVCYAIRGRLEMAVCMVQASLVLAREKPRWMPWAAPSHLFCSFVPCWR